MEFLPTSLPGVIRIRNKIFGDARGFFTEVYQAERFATNGIPLPFVQDNLSRSQRGVLRGLHYQIQHAQGKLVTCLNGEIWDVAVDIRKSSPTFGQWTSIVLTGENRESFYIPPGFAHGFCVLSETADVFYKCTDIYHPEFERTLIWNDPAISIEWPELKNVTLSEKDRQGLRLADAETYP